MDTAPRGSRIRPRVLPLSLPNVLHPLSLSAPRTSHEEIQGPSVLQAGALAVLLDCTRNTVLREAERTAQNKHSTPVWSRRQRGHIIAELEGNPEPFASTALAVGQRIHSHDASASGHARKRKLALVGIRHRD